MKFLVLGATGMAGHTIALYLKQNGHSVTGFSRSKSNLFNSLVGDAFNTKLLKRIILDGNYDIVVNCIGILNDDAEKNKEKAVFINSYIPHFLAFLTKDINTRIIHLSTDCVFSGKRGNYKENDFKDGESFYDRTKALGEIDDEKNLTLRNSIIGPDINSKGVGLLNWFMQTDECVYGFKNVIWTGITTLQLAKIIDYAARNKMTGLYNMVPTEKISKYDLLVLMNKYLKKKKVKILENTSRVVDKSLLRTNFEVDIVIPDYETMFIELLKWMEINKDIYKHYNIND